MNTTPLVLLVTNWKRDEVLKTFAAGSLDEALRHANRYISAKGSVAATIVSGDGEYTWHLDGGVSVILRPMDQDEITKWVNLMPFSS